MNRTIDVFCGAAIVMLATFILAASAKLADAADSTQIKILHVGHEDISSSFIQDYDASFNFFSQKPDGTLKPAGTWTDHLHHFDNGGTNYLLRRVVRFPTDSARGDLERVMISHADTLAPVSNHQTIGSNLDTFYAVHYRDADITGVLSSSATFEMRNIDTTLSQAPFNLSFWATLAMSVPFVEGYSAQIPVFNPSVENMLDWETFTVIGQEKVNLNDRSYDAWLVVAENSTWKFWVRKTAPYIVKIDHPNPAVPGERAVSLLHEWQ